MWRKENVMVAGMTGLGRTSAGSDLIYVRRQKDRDRIRITYNVTNREVDDGFTAILTFEKVNEVPGGSRHQQLYFLPRWYVLGEDGTAVIRTGS